MTTIAYKDGIMAADTRAYSGNKVPIGNKIKARKLADGTLVGVGTNQVGMGEAIIGWVERGSDPEDGIPKFPNFDFVCLKVMPNGDIYYASDSFGFTGPLAAPFWAIGSGGEYAMGAMAQGASAEQAVAIAKELDVWSGGDTTLLYHDRHTVVTAELLVDG